MSHTRVKSAINTQTCAPVLLAGPRRRDPAERHNERFLGQKKTLKSYHVRGGRAAFHQTNAGVSFSFSGEAAETHAPRQRGAPAQHAGRHKRV